MYDRVIDGCHNVSLQAPSLDLIADKSDIET